MIALVAVPEFSIAQGRGQRGQRGGGQFDRPGGIGGREVSVLDVVRRSDVQEELKLTESQIENINAIAQEAGRGAGRATGGGRGAGGRGAGGRGAGGGGRGGFQDLSDDERQAALAERRQQRLQQQEELTEKVNEVLKASQRTRLAELTFQYSLERGAAAGAATAAGVELSDADREKLVEKQQEIMAKVSEQIAKIQRDAQLEVLETVMSTLQIEKAMGAEFSFEQQQGRGGRGGGGQGARTARRDGGGSTRPARPSGDADDSEDRVNRRRQR